MRVRHLIAFCLCFVMFFSSGVHTQAAASSPDVQAAAAHLKEVGVMVGDKNGEMNLERPLNRTELAVLLTRLAGNAEHVEAGKTYYIEQCQFPDVPEWGKLYVGFCAANGLMTGYGDRIFGAGDKVVPAAACTVILRYLNLPDIEWSYPTACQTATALNLLPIDTAPRAEITRGDMALLIYRALKLSDREPPETAGITISSYKGNSLAVGDRSGLIINPKGVCSVESDSPSVLSVEQVFGNWVAVARSAGTATITAADHDGNCGALSITVGDGKGTEPPPISGTDLSLNLEIREDMIKLINQVRRENGVREVSVNQALMDAAQDCSSRRYTWHHTQEECEAVIESGYPYGFGNNLTVFTGGAESDIAQRAVTNWVNSPGHFQTMIAPGGECIGVGVTRHEGVTYCYMFIGDPNTHNPYE